MKPVEEFLEEMEKNLSAIGMPIEKGKLQNYLLKPGPERLHLIQWALSQIGVVVKEEKDIPRVLCEFGICVSTDLNVVMGECSEADNIKFWTKLFNIVHTYKETNQEAAQNSYKKIADFWLNLSSGSTLRQILQPKNTSTKVPLKVQHSSDQTISREELMNARISVLNELKELDQEKEHWPKVGDLAQPETDFSSISKTTEEVEKLRVLASRFVQSSSWLHSKLSNRCVIGYENMSDVIVDLNDKVEKINLYCEESKKLLAALDAMKNATHEESNDTTNLSLIDEMYDA